MRVASKPTELRDTGISALGRVPWSAHFSLFYETPADLVDAIVPYFKAGLDAGELCVWLPSEGAVNKVVEDALRHTVPDFDSHLADGNVEFISSARFYRPEGAFDAIGVIMRRWAELLERTDNGRYAGLRGSGDLGWLGAADWLKFSEYENTLHQFLRGRPAMVLCTYPLRERRASDILDSARAHHLVLARRQGAWDIVETPSLAKTKEQIQRRNDELEERVAERTKQLVRSESYLAEGQRLSHTGSFGLDVTTGEFIHVSEESLRMFGFEPDGELPRRKEMLARVHPEDGPRLEAEIRTTIVEGRDTESEFRVVFPDGRTRYLYSVRHPVLDDAGRVVEVVGTSIDNSERKRAAANLTRIRRAARERAVEARFAAALEERTRLAREIHDSLLQGVTGIALQLRATLPRLKGTPAAATESIRGVVELAESTIRDARQAVWDMRAPSLVQKGLPKALEEAVHRAAVDVALEFAIDGKPRPLPQDVEDTIFRVGQEGVLNAVKHAAAKGISVRLAYKPRSMSLTVIDDGRGFRTDQAFRAYAGRWGLLGMRERADRIGGSLKIRSAPGRGTTVELRVPAARPAKGR